MLQLLEVLVRVCPLLIANYHDFDRHKIVIVEGNYLLLEEDVWTEIRDLFDEKW
jgi:pantothenate kinase